MLDTAIGKMQLIISVMSGAVMSALGGYDVILGVLLAFCVADYISGILLAVKTKTLNSKKGTWGLLKKALIFLVVFLAHMLDMVTGLGAIRSIVVMFYISNEGISVLENLGKLGVKYPKKVKEVLEQLEGEDEDNEDTKSDN